MTVDILESRARALVTQQGGVWSDRGGLCRCPAHPDRSPSLSVRVGERNLLLHCFAGCAIGDILSALGSLGHSPEGAGERLVDRSGLRTGNDRLRAAARRTWAGGRSIVGTSAERYLASRGIFSISPELRFHPRAPFGARPLTSFRPALLAAVRDENGLVAVQRTYLDAPTLHCSRGQRRALGSLGQGAVRLGGVSPTLGLAEGLETALSARQLFRIPCWATLGSERFAKVAIPSEVTRLILFIDHDAGGRRAELLIRSRFPNSAIDVEVPARRGEDWNDVLRAVASRESGRLATGGSGLIC